MKTVKIAFLFPVFTALPLMMSCSPVPSNQVKSETSQSLPEADPLPAYGTEELGASDLSIIVPLQSSYQSDVADSAFGKLGTGMCNAPTLDAGGDDPILSEAQWQDWAKDTLLSVLPLPATPDVWTPSNDNLTIPERQGMLYDSMMSLPDVDSDDLCPEPIGAEDIKTDKIELLRNAGSHVAATQTLPAGACRYKDWHVVGARFEPCSYRPKVLADKPSAFDASVNKTIPSDECGGAELRLVLQPFIPRADGGYGSIDMAIHAFYKLEDPAAFIEDLRSLRRTTRAALAGKTGEGSDAIWYSDTKDVLLPHPGLREEMDCGENGTSHDGTRTVGPVGQEWQRVLTKYARQSRLFKMTWMTSDNSGGNWSFGLRLVQPEFGTTAPRKVVRLEPFKVESFTLSQVSRGFPYTPFDMTTNTVDYWYKDGRTDKTLDSDVAKAAVKEIIDIANPDKVSLNLGGKLSASCASCHTRDQTERAIRTRAGKTHEELAAIGGTSSWTVPMWDPIKKIIDKRNDNNLRNFGYGPAMNLTVSRRVINETEALRRLVKDYYSSGVNPASSAVKGNAEVDPSALTFAQDIQPVLTARCGYCHSTKRDPMLLVEKTAKNYAYSIVANICAEAAAYDHMPPGKVLPNAEKKLFVAWFKSLYPDTPAPECAGLR